MRSALVITVLAFGCSGGDGSSMAIDARSDGGSVDAVAPTDATQDLDGRSEISCTAGGASTVTVDLGGDAAPIAYPSAWWNHGHVSKACFQIDVVLSRDPTIVGSYFTDPRVLEVQFGSAPTVGANPVQVHLHSPDTWMSGTVELSTASTTEYAGFVSATSGLIRVDGSFTASQCAAIFDPCL
jgi:hypothetical protein